MPELVVPTVAVRRSFVEAIAELRAEAEGMASDSMVAREAHGHPVDLADPAVFSTYVQRLRADVLADSPRPTGHVPATMLWYVGGDRYHGRLQIRHRLTPFLLEEGGHIGYLVRPSSRRQGHATAMLQAALPFADDLGIDPVLVTCDTDNVASARVIEQAGGVLDDVRGVKRRYWIATGHGRGGSRNVGGIESRQMDQRANGKTAGDRPT